MVDPGGLESPVKGTIKSLAQVDETYDVGTEIATIEVEVEP